MAIRFERASHRALLTSYTRKWRQRQRAGLVQLKVIADEASLAIFLVDCRLLTPTLADDRRALSEAAGRALALLCDVGESVMQQLQAYADGDGVTCPEETNVLTAQAP